MSRLLRIVFACAALGACGSPPTTLPGRPDAGEAPDAGPPEETCPERWTAPLVIDTPLADEVTHLLADGTELLVAGYERGQLGARLDPGGDSLGFVRRFDEHGELVREARFDTSGSDVVEAIVLQGDLVRVVGRTTGAFPGFTNGGQADLFLATLNADHERVSLVQHGGPKPEYVRRAALVGDESLAVAGYHDIYIPTNYVESWEDPFVSVYSLLDGTESWSHSRQTETTDFVFDVAAHPEHGIFTVGNVSAGAERGAWVWRRLADGSPSWGLRLSPNPYDVVYAATLTGDGRLLVAGSTFQTLGERSYGQQDAFVAVIEPDTGNLVEVWQAGTEHSEWVTGLALGPDGAVWVAGERIAEDLSSLGVFAIRFSAEGEVTGTWSDAAGHEASATSIAVDACGRAFVGGWRVQTEGGDRQAVVWPVALE